MDKELFDFIKNAYTSGLCNEYRDEIRNCHDDKLQLIRLALRQQSIPWVATKIHEGVVSKEYLQTAFSKYLNGFILNDCDGVSNYTYSWFVDWDCNKQLILSVDVAHISHTKGTTIIFPQTKCPIVYISNESNVNFVCEGFNGVRIYLLDSSTITIEDADETCSATIYKYSDKCKVNYGKYCLSKRIHEHQKELRL